MKIFKICMCFFLLGLMQSPVVYQMSEPLVDKVSEDVILRGNGEELTAVYQEFPTFEMEISEMLYSPSLRVVLENEKHEIIEEVHEEWKQWNGKWWFHWECLKDVEHVNVALLDEEQVLYRSTSFTIDSTVNQPQMYFNDKLIEQKNYVSNQEAQIRICFDEVMDQEKSKLYIDGKETSVTWDTTSKEVMFLLEEEKHYTITYEGYDLLGNQIKGAYQISIDKQLPLVHMFLDDDEVQDFDMYYAKEMKLKFVIEEALFDDEHSKIWDNGKEVDLTWEYVNHEYEAIFEGKEGKHQISYEIKDHAGNMTKKTYSEYIFDVFDPQVSIRNENLLIAQAQHISYEIQESYIDEKNSYVNVVRNKEAYQRIVLDDEKGMLDFYEDGSYELEFVVMDKVGHTTTKALSFVIDHSAPIWIVNCNQQLMHHEEEYITNKEVTLKFAIEEKNLSDYFITVYKNKQKILEQDNLTNIYLPAVDQQNNDYVITLQAKDKAGNQSIQQIAIGIHKKVKPVILENDVFHKLPYANSWKPKIQEEGNQIHILSSLLYKNHLPIPYQWGDIIEEEGDYSLDVVASDQAMNVTGFTKTFNFTIDKSAPLLTLTNGNQRVKKDVEVNKPLTMSILQKDIEKRKEEHIAYIKINGKVLDNINGQTYTFTLDKVGEYEIECKSYDAAGNQSIKHWKLQAKKTPSSINKRKYLYMGGCILLASIIVSVYYRGRRKS